MNVEMRRRSGSNFRKFGFAWLVLPLSIVASSNYQMQYSSAADNIENTHSYAGISHLEDDFGRDRIDRSSGRLDVASCSEPSMKTPTPIVSPAEKIEKLRYDVREKSSNATMAVVVDTARIFYENVRFLWNVIADEIDANNNVLLLFAYNDTNCRLVAKLRKDRSTESLPKAADTTFETGLSLACVNFALKTMKPGGSIFLITGRPPADEFSLGKSMTLEMIRRRCEFYGIWCANATEHRDGISRYERIARRTRGDFIQFTSSDRQEIASQFSTPPEETAAAVDESTERAVRINSSSDATTPTSTAVPSQSGELRSGGTDLAASLAMPIASERIVSTNLTNGIVERIEQIGIRRQDHESPSFARSRPLRDKYDARSLDAEQRISSRYDRGDPNQTTYRSANIMNQDGRREALEAEDMQRASLTVVEASTRLGNISVEVTSDSNLVARPGAVTRVTFRITNSYPLTVRHYFGARSSTVSIVNLSPRDGWIESGETVDVAVDVFVPTTTSASTTGTVTLIVQGISSIEKSAYIYVQDTASTTTDTSKPTLDYDFNNNCAGKLSSDVCANNLWSVVISVRDSGSGLKRVSSSPKGIVATASFISGTKSTVKFQYASTCCQTSVIVTAEDLLGNSNSQTIDVTVWYNLSQGEIIAIVIGVLLLLLLLVIIILLLIFCIRKRKESHDLSYTQRYGTRTTPARAQRTSF